MLNNANNRKPLVWLLLLAFLVGWLAGPVGVAAYSLIDHDHAVYYEFDHGELHLIVDHESDTDEHAAHAPYHHDAAESLDALPGDHDHHPAHGIHFPKYERASTLSSFKLVVPLVSPSVVPDYLLSVNRCRLQPPYPVPIATDHSPPLDFHRTVVLLI